MNIYNQSVCFLQPFFFKCKGSSYKRPIPDTFQWSLLNIVDNLSSLWCVVVKPVPTRDLRAERI